MKHCRCGKEIPRPPQEKRRRGGREREYCSDACRQRACRQRNTCKHDLDRLISQSLEHLYTSAHQEVHRESWQDELEMHELLIASLLQQLEQAHQWNDYLESRIDTDRIERDLLLQQIADQEAELTQLRFLLEASSPTISSDSDCLRFSGLTHNFVVYEALGDCINNHRQ